MGNYRENIIYQTEDGLTKIDVNMQDKTMWLSLEQMAELFERDKSTISRHIKIFLIKENFLESELLQILQQFKMKGSRQVGSIIDYYNLDVIISVGYRVKSKRGVQFRIWATNILREYIKKDFAMDDDCLKELLERIRDIRSSEKVFYRQVLEQKGKRSKQVIQKS